MKRLVPLAAAVALALSFISPTGADEPSAIPTLKEQLPRLQVQLEELKRRVAQTVRDAMDQALADEPCSATALVKLSPPLTPLLSIQGDDKASTGGIDFNTFKGTQQTLITSHLVLSAALRRKEVAELPFVKKHEHPESWLRKHLEVTFPNHGAIMEVRLAGQREDAEALVELVDAVVAVYLKEQETEVPELHNVFDTLGRTYTQMMEDIRKRLASYKDRAKQLGAAESENASVDKDLRMERLHMLRLEKRDIEKQLLETELAMKLLETSQSEKGSTQYEQALKGHQLRKEHYMNRLTELDAEYEQLSEEIRKLAEVNSDLQMDKAELDQLQALANALASKIERLKVDLYLPRPVTLLQKASVEYGCERREPQGGAHQ